MGDVQGKKLSKILVKNYYENITKSSGNQSRPPVSQTSHSVRAEACSLSAQVKASGSGLETKTDQVKINNCDYTRVPTRPFLEVQIRTRLFEIPL